MAEIYSTNLQKGVRQVSRNPNDPDWAPLERLCRWNERSREKLIFLVETSTLLGAIRGTEKVVFSDSGRPSLSLPTKDKDQSLPLEYWLCVYFGARTIDPWIIIESIKIESYRISLVYSVEDPTVGHLMHHEFFAWAPLGNLKPGKYRLLLIDSSKKHQEKSQEVTLQ